MERLKSAIRDCVRKIQELRSDYQGSALNEANTRGVLIEPILNALGWDLLDPGVVQREYRHASHHNPVDYALFLGGKPVIYVEAKALNEGFGSKLGKSETQAISYANNAGVRWCILTNGAGYRVYNVYAECEAENKMFLEISLGGRQSRDLEEIDGMARNLELISPKKMRTESLDGLWNEWDAYRKVVGAIKNLPGNEKFVNLLNREISGVNKNSIRRILGSVGFERFEPSIEDVLSRRRSRDEESGGRSSDGSRLPARPQRTPPETARSEGRTRLMKTPEMFEKGLLKKGDRLTIRSRADSEAEVVDGHHICFRGEKMKFNAWGCRVTGWKSIQIYAHAQMKDGRLLQELRNINLAPAGSLDQV